MGDGTESCQLLVQIQNWSNLLFCYTDKRLWLEKKYTLEIMVSKNCYTVSDYVLHN